MPSTIITKNGSGAPLDTDLVAGELAVDLTNGRLYTTDLDTGGTVLELGTNPASDVTFGDNTKAIFGAGSDLQIYHNATNNIIDSSAATLAIQAPQFVVQDDTGAKNIIWVTQPAASVFDVRLSYDGSTKLSTTATGIDVTGTVTADGLTVDDVVSIDTSTGNAFSSTGNLKIDIDSDNNQTDRTFQITSDGSSKTLFQAEEGGDVSFYEDTGTTAKFFWDASAEKATIGNIVISENADSIYTASGALYLKTVDASDMYFRTNNVTRATIDSSGNVGIGAVPANGRLHVTAASGVVGWFETTGLSGALGISNSGTFGMQIDTASSSGFLTFTKGSGSTEFGRFDTDGNLLVGKTAPNSATAGVQILPEGDVGITRNGSHSLLLNRLTSDGDIALFRKDGTTVGSIGIESSGFYIDGEASHSGLSFGGNSVVARDNGTRVDDTVDLGSNVHRFKDLFLSGGVDISYGAAPQTAFIDFTQTINDDAVFSFTPDKSFGVIYIYGRNVNYDEVFGIVSYRTVSSAFCTKQLDPSSVISVSTSVLTGTTGTDGQVTISAVQSDGKIYIENRRGVAISIGIHVTGQ